MAHLSSERPPRPCRTVNILFLGAGQVGKTSLINQLFIGTGFSECHKPTSYEVYDKLIESDQGQFRFQITDFAGEYSFPPMRRLTIARNDIFVLVYSIQDLKSLEYIELIRNEIREVKGSALSQIPFIVVGNKSDMTSESESRLIERAEKVLDGWSTPLVLTSAKERTNMSELFEAIVQSSEAMTTPKIESKLKLCNGLHPLDVK